MNKRVVIGIFAAMLVMVAIVLAQFVLNQGSSSNSATVSPLDVQVVGLPETLTGSLIFVEQRGQPYYRIGRFDFSTKQISTVLSIPSGEMAYQIDASPDGQQLIMAYMPLGEDGNPTYDRSGLYLLDLTQASPKPERLLGGDKPNVYYAYPVWTADYIYYVTYAVEDKGVRRLERYNLKTKAVEPLLRNANYPAISADGQSLVYMHIDPDTQKPTMMIANADGKDQRELLTDSSISTADVDLPFFSPDGQWVYFVVLEEVPADTTTGFSSVLNRLLGGSVAKAHGDHNRIGHWYRVPITGGTPELVEKTEFTLMYSEFIGDQMLFVSDEGLYVTDAGRPPRLLLKSRAIRSFAWIPAEKR